MGQVVFKPDQPYATRRVYGKSQTLLQNGSEFSLRRAYLGPNPDKPKRREKPAAEEATPEPVSGRTGVLQRAAQKLEGFVTPEDPQGIRTENGKAAAAERYAE